MCMTLAMGAEYNRDFFVKSSDAKWYEAIFVRILSFFYIPRMIKDLVLARSDDNYITRKKKDGLSGVLNVRTTDKVDFRLLKALSKTIKVTINDIVTSALTTALHKIFRD